MSDELSTEHGFAFPGVCLLCCCLGLILSFVLSLIISLLCGSSVATFLFEDNLQYCLLTDNYLSHQYLLLENSQRAAVIWLDGYMIIFHVQE